MKTNGLFEQFENSLYEESPRGGAEFESMKFAIMARLGLNETDALELAGKIIASPKSIHQKENGKMTNLTPPDKLGNFPIWTPGKDGNVPWVFADRPAGHRCAWSCLWNTRNPDNESRAVVIGPQDWGATFGNMSGEQIAAELADNFVHDLLSRMPFGGIGQEVQFTNSLALTVEVLSIASPMVEQMLMTYRQSYQYRSYISPYDPPRNVIKNNRRPGWG
jgi:hypothetical protein